MVQLVEVRVVNVNVILSYVVGFEVVIIVNGCKIMGWKVFQVGVWLFLFLNYIDGVYGGVEGLFMV